MAFSTISPDEPYNALAAYTLTHGHPSFIHQYVVDAYTLQQANASTKPMAIAFALAGLYLHLEKNFTGREVQRMHMKMAKRKRDWPLFELPPDRGTMTANDVLAKPPGPDRDKAIETWMASVWAAFRDKNRQPLIDLLREYGV